MPHSSQSTIENHEQYVNCKELKKRKKKHKKPTVSEKKTVKEVGGKGKCLFQELLTAFGKCSGKLSFQERDGQ